MKNYISKTTRDSRFELLRVMSVLMILLGHYMSAQVNYDCFNELPINSIIRQVFGSWSILGVDCFVALYAYFSVDRELDNKYIRKKAMNVTLDTVLYSIIGLCVFSTMSGHVIKSDDVMCALFSPFNYAYWYITSYLVLVMVTPYLNVLINNLDDKSLLQLAIIILFWGSILDALTIPGIISDAGMFVGIYVLMAYLKKYYIPSLNKDLLLKQLTFIFIGLVVLVMIIQAIRIYFGLWQLGFILSRHSGVMICMAVLLVFIFAEVRPFKSTIVNVLSSGTLACYVLHANPIYQYKLWNDIFKLGSWSESLLFLGWCLWCVFLTLMISSIISLLRNNLRFIMQRRDS